MLTPEDLQAIRVIVTEIVREEVRKESRRLERRLERKFDKKIKIMTEYFEGKLMRHHERLDRIEQHLGIYETTPEYLKLHDAPSRKNQK